MTVYIGFVELWTAVTVDGKIFSQAAEVKMAGHKGFVKLCTAATADGDFFFFLFFILRRYKFLIYKFINSTMNIIHTLIKIDGC